MRAACLIAMAAIAAGVSYAVDFNASCTKDPVEFPSMGNLLYDPCNCAPGFWCGCSSTDPADCVPSANYSETQWRGVYVAYEDGESTPTYHGNVTEYACPSTFFCPGTTNAAQVPGLCTPGFFCPTSDAQIICPAGSFCPSGSVNALECPKLSSGCKEPGVGMYKNTPVLGIAIGVTVAYLVLLYVLAFLNRTRRSKQQLRVNEKQSADNGGAAAAKGLMGFEESGSEITRLSFQFEHLQLTLDNGVQIMKDASGEIPAGSLTGVMGPSGAGKTTLLNMLSGKVPRTGGCVMINGEEDEIFNYRRIVGFVPQEDVMHRDMTVYENILHSALVRLPKEWPLERKHAQVEHVISLLGLTRVRNSLIGDERVRGISGGQRKRVNVAMELVTNPSVLFLDEPTSGLDSSSSTTVLSALKYVAAKGVNVITVLHQPKYSIFESFDRLVLLGVGGKVVFMGSPADAISYFESIGYPCPDLTNPADFFMDVISGLVECSGGQSSEDLADLWNAKTRAATSSEEVAVPPRNKFQKALSNIGECVAHTFGRDPSRSKRSIAGFWTQLALCFKRAVAQRLHTPSTTLAIALVALVAGIILGLATRNSIIYSGVPTALVNENTGSTDFIGYQLAMKDFAIINSIGFSILFLWVVLLLVSSTAGVSIFGYERSVYFREMAAGNNSYAYYFAKLLESIPSMLVFTVAYAGGYFGVSHLRQPFGQFYLVVTMLCFGFYGLGIIASVLTSREKMTVVAIIAGLILTAIFTGLTPKAGLISSGIKWLWYLTFSFWNANAFYTAELEQYEPPYDIAFGNDPSISGNNSTYAYGFELYEFGKDIGLSFATAMLIIIVGAIVMRAHHYRKQR
mmetsp:Transcript_7124/g.15227  ORF Transcript_7124/g.15227 Transcript_7124/m.15227 type:complete len:853 (-) Transcript_7124:98-2656(-)